ncbi:MAG TPA: ATP-binding protein [Chitinophagaceae bacterium]|nr:ATP-binding protein [Chitinophagaceae bacterium]
MQVGNKQIVIFLIVTTFLILVLLGLIVTILYLYQKKRIAFQKHLAVTQLEIQEETFQNISREIHDNIGLSLTLAKLHLNTLTLNPSQTPHASIITSIELITQAIHDLSDISKNLNSEAIRNQGFLNVLTDGLERLKKCGRYDISFSVIGTTTFMDIQKETILYRITQEALNNIIKHSNASKIHFQLNYNDAHLSLFIKDDGVGINWAQMEKAKLTRIMAGLNNMKARAKLVNGTCNVQSDETGTSIYVTIPY